MNKTCVAVAVASLATLLPAQARADLQLVEAAGSEALLELAVDEIAAPRGATAAYLVMGTFGTAGDQRELWTIVEAPGADGAPVATFFDANGAARCKLESGAARELSVTPGSSPQASGLPTGKRQHKPFAVTKPVDKLVDLEGNLLYQSTGGAIVDDAGAALAVATADHGPITTLELVTFAAAFGGYCR